MRIAKSDRIVILGLGVTGHSCLRFCCNHTRNITRNITILDTRQAPPMLAQVQAEFPDMAIHLGELPTNILKQADWIIASPGIDLHRLGLHHDKRVLGDIELFAHYVNKPVIGITGTNGKSTVTDLVGELINGAGLRAYVGGNIGKPALDLLAADEPDYYVLELSSFQLETTRHLHLAVAVYLNLSPDHLDRYPSNAEYAAAKQRIFNDAEIAVFNADDAATKPSSALSTLSFSLQHNTQTDYYVHAGNLMAKGEIICAADKLELKGQQNWANALAAIAVGDVLGLDRVAMAKTLQHYSGLQHRCEWVRQINNVQWINDSKATNVGATIAALDGLAAGSRKNIILLAGGQAKDSDFSGLSEPIAKHVQTTILFGQDANLIAAAIQDKNSIVQADDMQHAIAIAQGVAQGNDIVLLSPACASFDMFDDFNQRGSLFKQWVKELDE